MSTSLELFGLEVKKLIGDYEAFVGDLLERLKTAGASIESRHLTHLLYRTATMAEYKKLRDQLRPLCREFVETQFHGRSVSIMTLRHALDLPDDHSVVMIELPAPREGHAYPSGLEHIGVMLGDELGEFKQTYAAALTGTKDYGHDNSPAYITFDNDKTVKFYSITLRDLVILEGWRFEEPLEPEDAPVNRIARTVNAWREYLYSIDNAWQPLVDGITPKQTGSGAVYELANPIERPGESFAIADMRTGKVAEPHYHQRMTEIYMVLEGSGTVVVGGEQLVVEQDATVIIPPNAAHFTLPQGLVLAAINTPPFEDADYLVLTESNPELRYDQALFDELTK